MTPAAHAQAAIEVLTEIEERRSPAAKALKDWGAAHRFAGSGDRARIASLTYDALRQRASIAWRMGSDAPRALALGTLAFVRGVTADGLAASFSGDRHAPAAPDEAERAAIAGCSLDGAPAHVAGDYPEWLDAGLAEAFGDDRAAEGAALAQRAPLDLRVNVLKGDRDKALAALAHLNAEATPLSPFGLRVALTSDGRGPPVQAEPAFLKGLVEVQDEGSQLAALLAGAGVGEQVVDFCAGAGGKTLALGAQMDNRGQLYAHDSDIRRLAPMHERAERAGLRNLQIRSPRGAKDVLADLDERADLVLVDAPCTGTGTWRRNPDAKWRMRPGALEQRMIEQDAALDAAALLVRPGGRLVYVTCSLLPHENGARVAAFRERRPDFAPRPAAEAAAAVGAPSLAAHATEDGAAFLFTPRRSGTDGFFVAILTRS
ncbi:RsmB/NOP family class I SAM-dependent RNA methyltransferase [Chenggangzhangella methanolivorans]|uniref:RsmB/NOP family class I SAM-dependent RNA methyltransferase n=1 Tax=Chenggangzhangella methanolivorans TaxID=1437009 RepID=A0A9E6RA81_9HYPH|nr:RsmB/NOP family class I SAM-dependent RNA methyltransferase [Chenggangzhangella methanolivorans]QZN99663.1 RsmB/NOP family class I SAM-dependent RNA methyltransferase [Chenggangzhangella methanolivorans]